MGKRDLGVERLRLSFFFFFPSPEGERMSAGSVSYSVVGRWGFRALVRVFIVVMVVCLSFSPLVRRGFGWFGCG